MKYGVIIYQVLGVLILDGLCSRYRTI